MSATMNALHAEHAIMARLLDILSAEVDRFERAERPDYDLMKEIVDYFLTVPDLYHHPKEDLIHARLLRRGGADAEGMHDIPSEHERVSERLRAFAHALVNILLDAEFPRDRFIEIAREFIIGEQRHMKGEEAEFFPVAERLLSDDDWSEIDERFARVRDPLLDGAQTMRFQAIHDIIEG